MDTWRARNQSGTVYALIMPVSSSFMASSPSFNPSNSWPNAHITAKDQNGLAPSSFVTKEGESKDVMGKSPAHRRNLEPGTQPDHVYDTSMSWWRAGIRRILVQNLKAESRWIAAMQVSYDSRTLLLYTLQECMYSYPVLLRNEFEHHGSIHTSSIPRPLGHIPSS